MLNGMSGCVLSALLDNGTKLMCRLQRHGLVDRLQLVEPSHTSNVCSTMLICNTMDAFRCGRSVLGAAAGSTQLHATHNAPVPELAFVSTQLLWIPLRQPPKKLISHA